jgi:hypothetical protein
MVCFALGVPDSDYGPGGYGYPTNPKRSAAKPCGDI